MSNVLLPPSSALITSTATTLIHAFVCFRVGYGNTVYAGLTHSSLNRLQSGLNAADQLIGGIPRFGYVSRFMWEDLHWLPMQKCVELMILMFTHNCLAGLFITCNFSFTLVICLCCEGVNWFVLWMSIERSGSNPCSRDIFSRFRICKCPTNWAIMTMYYGWEDQATGERTDQENWSC